MFIRTRIAHGTVPLHKQRTCAPIRVEPKPVLFAQEVGEREPACKLVVLLRVRVEDSVGDAGRGCSHHRCRRRCGRWIGGEDNTREVVIIEHSDSRVGGGGRVTRVR